MIPSWMEIFDLARDRKIYQKIVSNVLTGLPKGIRAEEVIKGNFMFYRIFFNEDSTNFYITKRGELIYFEKEDKILERVSKSDIAEVFKNHLRNSDDD